jgi:xanthine dehydrogenase accessory factor
LIQPAALRVLFLGCGDLGTGAAHALFVAGFPVVVAELPRPLAVRRRVAFAEAARAGLVVVEAVTCRRLALAELPPAAPVPGFVPLVVEPIAAALAAWDPAVVVDARMTKRPIDPALPASTFRIALGPGHVAGQDCDVVVETLRGPGLGAAIWSGAAAADTGVPGSVGGATRQRLLRAPADGALHLHVRIGQRVRAGDVVAEVGGAPVRVEIGGWIRGLLADGDPVSAGQKLGDVDPRPDAPPADRISDKARAVGAGVLRVIATRFQMSLTPAP